VNRIDQETEKEARAHKGCRAIQEEESFIALALCNISSYNDSSVIVIYIKYFTHMPCFYFNCSKELHSQMLVIFCLINSLLKITSIIEVEMIP
jgi:hypothetical protein